MAAHLTSRQEEAAKKIAEELVKADLLEHPGGNPPDPAWVLEGTRLGYLWLNLIDKALRSRRVTPSQFGELLVRARSDAITQADWLTRYPLGSPMAVTVGAATEVVCRSQGPVGSCTYNSWREALVGRNHPFKALPRIPVSG